MLRHLLKIRDLTRRSERNAILTRTLFEAFKDRQKEYTNLRILAANEDTLLDRLIIRQTDYCET